MKNGIATFEQIEERELRALRMATEARVSRRRAERAERLFMAERVARQQEERQHRQEMRMLSAGTGILACTVAMGLFAAAGLWLGTVLAGLAGGGILLWSRLG